MTRSKAPRHRRAAADSLANSLFAGGGVLLGAGSLNVVSPWIWRKPLALEPNRSFWARSQAPLNSPLAVDLDVDVAVLGGGLTGLSSAYFNSSGIAGEECGGVGGAGDAATALPAETAPCS